MMWLESSLSQSYHGQQESASNALEYSLLSDEGMNFDSCYLLDGVPKMHTSGMSVELVFSKARKLGGHDI